MQEESQFTESIIKYEALVYTPLKNEFEAIGLDKQMEMLDGLIVEVKHYADSHRLPHPSPKTWASFQKSANWNLIARDAIKAKTFFGIVKKSIDKRFSK